MTKITATALGSLIALAALIALLLDGEGFHAAPGTRLKLYCAAGIKPPVERTLQDWLREGGVPVDVAYGGSGALLSGIEVTRDGDLYLAADDSYLDIARDKGLVAERFDIARMRPVIGVRKGNPQGVRTRRDLLREDVRVAMANPDAAAIGKVARDLLRKDGTWTRLEPRVQVFKPTVNDLANDLVIGAVDAAIVWDAVANQYDEIEVVRDDLLDTAARRVRLGVLTAPAVPAAALRFARFMAARDRGLVHFGDLGYEPACGDVWEPVPELLLMSGAMLNKAIDATIAEFEQREGVRVTRIYNGCGILVSQMRTGSMPDAYFSCDTTFLDMVRERFETPFTVSENRIVILAQKGNPRSIGGIRDLGRAGLRIGLAHEEKSALGALTRELLAKHEAWQPLLDSGNVVVWSATGDYLVNQMQTGSLDATLVYRSNAAAAPDDLAVVPIDDDGASASQLYAIATASKHKNTMRRLLDAIRSAASRRRFEELGFRWQAGTR